MSESKSNIPDSSPGKETVVRKDKIDKTLLNDVHSFLHHHHQQQQQQLQQKETQGTRVVKAPSVLKRAKKEVKALFRSEKKESSDDTNETRVETKLSESKLDSNSVKDVKALNIFERVKQEIEAISHTEGSRQHHKETHGLRDDIDEKTPLNDVKSPNAFERVKEEIEAIVQTVLPQKESQTRDEAVKAEFKAHSLSGTDIKPAKSIEKVKEPSEADNLLKKTTPPRHHKETHGRSDYIDENTQIGDVKGPTVFQRAKEELEAFVETIHPRKESNLHGSSTKSEEGGFMFFIGQWLEKICCPRRSTKKE